VGIPELDKYEISKADEEELSKMSESARRAAERELSERDRERVREQPRHGRKFPAALMRELEESDEDDELQRELRREKARIQFGGEGHPMEIEHEDDRYLDMEESKGSLSVWISQPRTQRWVRRMFSEFLRNFRDNKNTPVYENRIIEMCTNNKQSLEITYTHLSNKNPTLALWTAEEPTQILPLLDEVAFELVTDIFPQYDNIAKEVFVRIRDLPIVDNLRDLRQDHLNGLVKIKGVVTKRTAVYPQLKKMYFLCSKCGDRKGPIYHNENVNIKLGSCILCQTNGPFVLDEEETVYRNYQRITIQETPGSVPAGRVPRQKDVILLNDNIGKPKTPKISKLKNKTNPYFNRHRASRRRGRDNRNLHS
jgi:DNA replication licensing factor MCM2